MSSFLERQQKAMAASLAGAASKLSGASKPNSLKRPPPSPSPSVTSTTSAAPGNDGSGSTPKKIKRETTATIFSQPAQTGYGTELGSNIIYIVDNLKEHGKPKSLDDVLGHVNLHRRDDNFKRAVVETLKAHTKVNFIRDPKAEAADPENAWKTGKYEHLPIIPGVKDETSLLRYLSERKTAQGISVKDLKDGWPSCDETITKLEKAHKLLVVRTKKDGVARTVWIDDPSLHHDVDAEFKLMWHRVEVPPLEDIVRKLAAAGQKPTSDDPQLKVHAVAKDTKKNKKRAVNIKKMTNVHMAGLLKNFDHIKK